MTDSQKNKWVIASDVTGRDGIGIELYQNDELILEIFRDDTKRSREVTMYKKNVHLSLIEDAISNFKNEISWDFLD